jgi:hypothetical protein
MTSDLGSLLNRAAAAPLGPLSFTYLPDGAGWSLTVKASAAPAVNVRVDSHFSSGGLCLERQVPAGGPTVWPRVVESAPWVLAADTTAADMVVLRLWLHGDGLDVNVFLAALAYFSRLGAADIAAAAQDDIDGEVIATLPQPAVEPTPVVPVRPLAWQSFGMAPRAPSPTTEPPRGPNPQPEQQPSVPEQPAVAPEAAPVPAEATVAIVQPVVVEPAIEVVVAIEAPALASTPAPAPDAAAPAAATPEPAGVSGTCRECGTPHRPDHAFCTTCGARLT